MQDDPQPATPTAEGATGTSTAEECKDGKCCKGGKCKKCKGKACGRRGKCQGKNCKGGKCGGRGCPHWAKWKGKQPANETPAAPKAPETTAAPTL